MQQVGNEQIADFSDAQYERAQALVTQRYGQVVEVERADSELRLDPASDAISWCPTLYWQARGAHFVVFKVGEHRYRSQFFYTEADHYGTGHEEYDDFELCVLTVLRVQADHERDSASQSASANAAAPEDDYHGPAML